MGSSPAARIFFGSMSETRPWYREPETFIALAALIFGRWTPIGAFGAALVFGVADTLGQAVQFNPPTGDLGALLSGVPTQVFSALPYLVTIIVLAGVVGRSIPPAADGQPYEREAKAS